MEVSKIITQTSWMISASKEQMRFLNKDIKNLFTFSSLKNLLPLNKVMYHLNMSKILLNQLEKNYMYLFTSNSFVSSKVIKLKNTYLQRCVFQYLLSFDYYKEMIMQVESVSQAMNRSLIYKWNSLNNMLNKLIEQFDLLLSKIK